MGGTASRQRDIEAAVSDNHARDFNEIWHELLVSRENVVRDPRERQLNYERNNRVYESVRERISDGGRPAVTGQTAGRKSRFWKSWIKSDEELSRMVQ